MPQVRRSAAVAATLAGVLVFAFSSPAQERRDPIQACAEKLVPYAGWRPPSSDRLLLRAWNGSGGELQYFGTRHSTDPRHSQLRGIENAIEWFKPTVILFEGPDSRIEPGREETIRRYGESGFVRYLAAQRGIAATTLEPDQRDEIGHLLARYEPQLVKLYSLLREVVLLRERRGQSDEEIRAAVEQLVRTPIGIPALDGSVTSLDELEEAFHRHWPRAFHWLRASREWFDPRLSSHETGGVFTNEMERISAEYRDLHMYRALARAAREGQRVFAAVGRTHLSAQEPALRCALLAPADSSPPPGDDQ